MPTYHVRKLSLPFAVTEYFKGQNWKVHPDFVYCEYNRFVARLFRRIIRIIYKNPSDSLKDMDKELENSGDSFFRDREDSFDTPEEQVVHFMSRAGRPGWKWMSVSLQRGMLREIPKTNFLSRVPAASSAESPTTPLAQWFSEPGTLSPATPSESELTQS